MGDFNSQIVGFNTNKYTYSHTLFRLLQIMLPVDTKNKKNPSNFNHLLMSMMVIQEVSPSS